MSTYRVLILVNILPGNGFLALVDGYVFEFLIVGGELESALSPACDPSCKPAPSSIVDSVDYDTAEHYYGGLTLNLLAGGSMVCD